MSIIASDIKKRYEPLAANAVQNVLNEFGLKSVCQSARCPNIYECFKKGCVTFLILGDICNRGCKFCSVKNGLPEIPDWDEPRKIAEAAKKLGLDFLVITSVTRDDLPDGGAGHFKKTLEFLRSLNPTIKIEILTPDFSAIIDNIKLVLSAKPDVFAHNVEMAPRLYKTLRPNSSYGRSINVLKMVKSINPAQITKSGFMVGIGETRDDAIALIEELKNTGIDILTIGQYLRPSKSAADVARYVSVDEFEQYRRIAEQSGIKCVESAPFVRSSYNALESYNRSIK